MKNQNHAESATESQTIDLVTHFVTFKVVIPLVFAFLLIVQIIQT